MPGRVGAARAQPSVVLFPGHPRGYEVERPMSVSTVY